MVPLLQKMKIQIWFIFHVITFNEIKLVIRFLHSFVSNLISFKLVIKNLIKGHFNIQHYSNLIFLTIFTVLLSDTTGFVVEV